MSPASRRLSPSRFLKRLRRDSRGNVLIMMGFAIVPIVFAVGFGMDYSRAMRLQTQINAAADAAALAAVNATMMQQSDANAQAAAVNMFNSQVSGLSGLTYRAATTSNTCTSGVDLCVQINPSGQLNTGRTVVVTWTGKSQNSFSTILGSQTLALSGTATAYAAKAPNINFYLVLDTSPSMLLPDTTTGLSNIRAATSSHLSGGCAFACHNMNPHNDNIYVQDSSGKDIFLDSSGNYYSVKSVNSSTGAVTATTGKVVGYVSPAKTLSGQYADGVWLTRNYGTLYGGSAIELRVDAETTAAQDLIPFAQQQASANQVTYKMQMFGFDVGVPVALTSSMTDVNNLTTSSVPDLMAQENLWYQNNQRIQGISDNDMSTEFLTMLNTMNSTMPTPGTGLTATSPQEVMFIITDGMDDELINGSRNSRELQAAHQTACSAIKNRGIKIAILYTQYLPESLTGDSWSQSNVAPYLPNILPALQACASTARDGTPLVYTVTTNQSISTALTALFALTIQNATLIH